MKAVIHPSARRQEGPILWRGQQGEGPANLDVCGNGGGIRCCNVGSRLRECGARGSGTGRQTDFFMVREHPIEKVESGAA